MEPDTPVVFGSLLRTYRVQAHLSQAALAERAGLSTAAINALERGVRLSPHLETVRLLTEALGLDGAQREQLTLAARQTSPPRGDASLPEAQAISAVPIPLTRCIGRDDAIAEICAQLRQGEPRLLSLVGPPGVGKTRLALEVAPRLAADFPDGVIFVPLAAIHDPALVLPSMVRAMGAAVTGMSPMQSAQTWLRHKRVLLVLDNCEQVATAAPTIAELLGHCPTVIALVTSRVPLRIQGEQEYTVAPLAVPDRKKAPTLDDVQQSPAVRLFLQRAQAIKPDFSLTAETAPSVAAICQRLDGLPLALELAAVRVKMLSVQNLLARLVSPLAILTGGAVDMPVHQQTLRSALAWSYQILTPATKCIFRQMAVFASSAPLATMSQVLAIDEAALLDGIADLTDHSLVVPQEFQGDVHFDMLVTIREYGREMLVQAGERDALMQRYAAHYLALAETIAPKLQGREQNAQLNQVEYDLDHYRAVLAYFRQAHAIIEGLRLCGALRFFWQRRGYLTEGRQWIDAFIGMCAMDEATHHTMAHAEALIAAGSLAWSQGDYTYAETVLAESLAISHDFNDPSGIAGALNTLGIVAIFRGEKAKARQLLEESLLLQRPLPRSYLLAHTLNNLGILQRMQGNEDVGCQLLEESLELLRDIGDIGTASSVLNNLGGAALRRRDFTRAHQMFVESLIMKRELGNVRSEATTLANLAEVAALQGNFAIAHQHYSESLKIRRKLDDKQGIAESERDLGGVAFATGAHAEAIAHYQASLLLFHEMGEKSGTAESLEMLACIATAIGQYEQALPLFAASATLRRDHELINSADKQVRVTAAFDLIHAHVSAADFARAWESGEAWSVNHAVQSARLITA